MSDLAILAELGFTVFVPREAEAPPLPFGIFLAEIKVNFSAAHHLQLTKILDYLGYQKTEYMLIFADESSTEACQPLLSFGIEKTPIHTHSISTMLSKPECKREVLHAIQSLRHS